MKKIDDNLCVICHAYGEDKRHLVMRCFYAIDEVVPELIHSKKSDSYEGWICKTCRGELLGAMKKWRDDRVKLREAPKDHDGYVDEGDTDRNIPVRVNGATVMMNEYEFKKYQSNP